MARGESSGEMNSRFIRTHIASALLHQHLHPRSVTLHAPPTRNPIDPERILFITIIFVAPQFWQLSGSRGKIKEREIKRSKLLKRGGKVNLNQIRKQQKQQIYCQKTQEEEEEKEKKKTCLTGEVFICTSVVYADIKHLMSAFFRDADERKRDVRLALSSHNQTVIRLSKQLAAQLSWHQTLTLGTNAPSQCRNTHRPAKTQQQQQQRAA